MSPRTCCADVTRDWSTSRCGKNAKIERDGRWYCGIHDPVRVAAKRAARSAVWEAERDESRRGMKTATDLLDRVKKVANVPDGEVGQPYYATRGYNGDIVLSQVAAVLLLEIAERAMAAGDTPQ